MSRTRSLALLGILLCSLVLTACVGRVPDAQRSRSVTEGVSANSGSIRVLNAMVVAAENADAGVVSMTVVNRGGRNDRLTSITSDGGEVTFASPRELPAKKGVSFGGGGGGSEDASGTATLRGLKASPGEDVTLKLTFEQAEPITLRTVVVPATGEYASITPAPEPTPTPAVVETPSPGASPSDSATPSTESS